MDYDSLNRQLARGWNTWDTRSVLSHVLLPEAFELNLGFYDRNSAQHLRRALVVRTGQSDARVVPGPHAYDGSYTELTLEWQKQRLLVQTAHAGADLVVVVSPLELHGDVWLVAECGIAWNRPGIVRHSPNGIEGVFETRSVSVTATTPHAGHVAVDTLTPHLPLLVDGPVGVSTGVPRSLDEIRVLIDGAQHAHAARSERYGALAEVHRAVQTCLAWDTIYEPENDRVISPVSRQWNVGWWGGWVLFCWDTFFAAYMLSFDNRELAYANAIAMLREVRDCGFVPNFAAADRTKSYDRSQPPVGAFVVRELFRRYGERWLVDETLDDLLTWNRFWHRSRSRDGYLAWGSNDFTPKTRAFGALGVHERFGGALESGLDNSPMYDAIPFDADASILLLADAGLMGLYVLDCECVADLAAAIGRTQERDELVARAEAYRDKLRMLWDDEIGIFANKRLDTGEFTRRVSPTNFYPLMARAASDAQARRMLDEHFYNPKQFWGDWILPSIARSDPAYADQEYWRGRIWAPMNFLVYLGLLRYDVPDARRDLAERSKALLLKEWRAHGHVHENYCANTGEGCNSKSSDAFYHWGGLLGAIALIEAGAVPSPFKP